MRLVRGGLLDDDKVRRRLSRRFVVLGVALGVPLHLLAAVAYYMSENDHLAWCLSQFGALPLALLYLTILLAVANTGWLSGLQGWLARSDEWR